eukprot:CAMPEP_0195056042 /NCGR_PEP_ID=MMETSP0448-20130528/4594_1 /TAXON_ID=66468 /ORGANISM="Heterocapsa triquestra, Strain CCMP 448" /LENGTH=130 /DNA_ID=CAMNT_0040085819 /DNA_START=142 /DNA_END=531 /DNA_ORIENTATION=-
MDTTYCRDSNNKWNTSIDARSMPADAWATVHARFAPAVANVIDEVPVDQEAEPVAPKVLVKEEVQMAAPPVEEVAVDKENTKPDNTEAAKEETKEEPAKEEAKEEPTKEEAKEAPKEEAKEEPAKEEAKE